MQPETQPQANPAPQPGQVTAPGPVPSLPTPVSAPGPVPPAPQPGIVQNPAPVGKPKPVKKILLAVVIIIVLATAGAGAFIYQQKQSSTKKFNALASKITQQELSGGKSITQFAAASNEIGDLISLDSSGPTLKSLLDTKISTLKTLSDSACKAKDADLTASDIQKQAAGLKLSASQKQYVSDWVKVIGDLQNSDYLNSILCSDGQVIAAFTQNFVALLPGLTTLEDVTDAPTADQVASLKQYTTYQITDKDQLTKSLPASEAFFETTQSLLSNLYSELSAIQAKDLVTAQKYDSTVTALGNEYGSDATAMTAEINNLDKKRNDAAIKASKEEITAIDYQKSHNNSSSANMQLDYALPAFRIVEATVTGYTDSHSSYPHGTSINDITQLNDDMQQLKDKKHLGGVTYTSLGSDDSGFSLSAKLSDGTVLSEKVDPTAQTT